MASLYTDWTLFLDRDGVINQRLPGDYVKLSSQFVFLPGVLSAIRNLSALFPRIVVVTNQQGIGKKIMSENDLERVHAQMLQSIRQAGGRIDAVLHCPALDSEGHPDRKPAPGMAFRAKEMFPEIDFTRSVMVGDSPSDILFGKGLGMKTVSVQSLDKTDLAADYHFDSLSAFADWLCGSEKNVFL